MSKPVVNPVAKSVEKKFVVCIDGKLEEWFEELESAIAYFREQNLGNRGMLLRMLPNPTISDTELHS